MKLRMYKNKQPKESKITNQQKDLFRIELEKIIDINHSKAFRLAVYASSEDYSLAKQNPLPVIGKPCRTGSSRKVPYEKF